MFLVDCQHSRHKKKAKGNHFWKLFFFWAKKTFVWAKKVFFLFGNFFSVTENATKTFSTFGFGRLKTLSFFFFDFWQPKNFAFFSPDIGLRQTKNIDTFASILEFDKTKTLIFFARLKFGNPKTFVRHWTSAFFDVGLLQNKNFVTFFFWWSTIIEQIWSLSFLQVIHFCSFKNLFTARNFNPKIDKVSDVYFLRLEDSPSEKRFITNWTSRFSGRR